MGSTTLLYVATLLVVGLLGLQAPTVFALGEGVGCMINAPSGAALGSQRAGHVGWAFQVGGTTTWYYGATESATQTWILSSTSQTAMLTDFKNGGPFHGVGYYTKWRCNTISNSAVGAALAEQKTTAANGYDLVYNNCLTKSVAILNAYGEGLGFNGVYEGPNYYFDHLAWGPVHTL